jgi:hypothetical protein
MQAALEAIDGSGKNISTTHAKSDFIIGLLSVALVAFLITPDNAFGQVKPADPNLKSKRSDPATSERRKSDKAQTYSQEPPVISKSSVQLNNDQVTVNRLTLAREARLGLEQLSLPAVLIILRDAGCNLIEGDHIRELNPGSVLWVTREYYAMLGSASHKCEAFLVTIKESPRARLLDLSRVPLDSAFQKIEIENQLVRVVRFTLKHDQKWMQDSTQPVASPPSVSIVVAEADLVSSSEWHASSANISWSNGSLVVLPRPATLPSASPPFRTFIENRSAYPYEVITIELKAVETAAVVQ